MLNIYSREAKILKIQLKWYFLIFYAQIFNKKIVFRGASNFLIDFLKKFKIKSKSIVGIIDMNTKNFPNGVMGYKVYKPNEAKDILNADYMIFTIINNHKSIYKHVKSELNELSSKIKLLKDDFEILEEKYPKEDSPILKETIKELNETISKISPNGCVYIFQLGFFDTNGKDFCSGGAERYMLDLAKIISNLGYKPILIQYSNGDFGKFFVKTMKDLTIIGINAKYTDYYKTINSLNEPALAIYSGMVNWAENIKYKNKIIISHGITWDLPIFDCNINSLKTIIKNFNYIVSVDTSTICYLRSTFSNYIFANDIKFDYVPNYVDANKFYPKENKREKLKITFPRRCSRERGINLLLNVIPKILKKYSDVLFEIIGFIHTEEVKDSIKKIIAKYPSNVIHKCVEQDKMQEVYQNTDISLIPTMYSEGTSLSCLEAMACKNAVIATNVGGLPNLIINNYNGKLINPDEDSLYNAIVDLIENKSLRDSLSKNALEVSKTFSKEYWDNNWLNILKKYLKQK